MYDILIVGAGITGSWTAKRLCDAGARVLLLEAGPEVTAASVRADFQWTPANRKQRLARQPVQARHPAYWQKNPDLFVDDVDEPYDSSGESPYCWIRGRQVGGRSVTWGGIMLRMSDHELHAADQDGLGPTWPVRHEELADSYQRIERFFGVAGNADGLSGMPDGAFSPPPPLTAAELNFRRTIESRWPDRRVVHSRGIRERASTTDNWPQHCMQHRVLPEACGTGLLDLRPNTSVTRILHSPQRNRATGVLCSSRQDGRETQFAARVVILCASTIESIRILLNSGGLANSSGLLGRYLIDHAAVWAVGRADPYLGGPPEPTAGAHGFIIPRFRNLRTQDQPFVRGYGIWGNAGRSSWNGTGHSLWSLCAMLEVLPGADNRIALSKTLHDAWGTPAPAIHLSYGENEHLMIADAQQRIREMAALMGWSVEAEGRMAPGGFVHDLGGARMGRDPDRSVLNSHNQSWDIPNLFVLDGSCFPSAGWQNPTLTMLALADRASSYIARQLSGGHL